MTPFTSLDQVLNAGALTPATSRDVTPGKASGGFQPFAGTNALATGREESDAGHEAPQIELVHGDGRIQQIIISCRCGERTVLDCTY